MRRASAKRSHEDAITVLREKTCTNECLAKHASLDIASSIDHVLSVLVQCLWRSLTSAAEYRELAWKDLASSFKVHIQRRYASIGVEKTRATHILLLFFALFRGRKQSPPAILELDVRILPHGCDARSWSVVSRTGGQRYPPHQLGRAPL